MSTNKMRRYENISEMVPTILIILIISSVVIYDIKEVIEEWRANGTPSAQGIQNLSITLFLAVFGTYAVYSLKSFREIIFAQRNIERNITYIGSGLGEKFISGKRGTFVAVDSKDQPAWDGFVGHYTAFNPTFGSDLTGEDIDESRANIHQRRYRFGVTGAHYYLYSGCEVPTVGHCDSESTEYEIMRRLVALINKAESIRPKTKIANRIRVTILAGKRSDQSIFLGKKLDREDALRDTAIGYTTPDGLNMYSDDLIPNLLIVSDDASIFNRLDSLMKRIIEQSRSTELKFVDFRREVLAKASS